MLGGDPSGAGTMMPGIETLADDGLRIVLVLMLQVRVRRRQSIGLAGGAMSLTATQSHLPGCRIPLDVR